MIRLATAHELLILRDVENATGRPFAEIGMTSVAEEEPPGLEVLGEYQRAGRAWVWADDSDQPIAFLVLGLVDGNAHIDEVAVHPDHAGRRIGRQLIDEAARWAAAHGIPALTLTTFTEVPWNGPYYARLGFRFLSAEEETPGLREVRAAEIARGLDRWPRACMRAEVARWQPHPSGVGQGVSG